MGLLRIVYCSLPTVPSAGERLDIMRVADARNMAAGVSGLLGIGRRNYFQLLEGEAHALRPIYASIARDLRHHMLWTEESSPLSRITSPDLPMGYLDDGEGGYLADCFGIEACKRTFAFLIAAGAHKYPRLVRA